MRTTLTIDDDVAALLEAERRRTGAPLKDVVNKALRSGLLAPSPAKREAFKVKPFKGGLPEGLTYDCIPALIDVLDGPIKR